MKKIILEHDDIVERYAHTCDALCRALWAKRYGISKNDPMMHTSDEARRVANAVFEALGIEEKE